MAIFNTTTKAAIGTPSEAECSIWKIISEKLIRSLRTDHHEAIFGTSNDFPSLLEELHVNMEHLGIAKAGNWEIVVLYRSDDMMLIHKVFSLLKTHLEGVGFNEYHHQAESNVFSEKVIFGMFSR